MIVVLSGLCEKLILFNKKVAISGYDQKSINREEKALAPALHGQVITTTKEFINQHDVRKKSRQMKKIQTQDRTFLFTSSCKSNDHSSLIF